LHTDRHTDRNENITSAEVVIVTWQQSKYEPWQDSWNYEDIRMMMNFQPLQEETY